MERILVEKRLRNFYVLVLCALVILVGRLWYLQIVQGEHYARLADGNRLRRVRITPARGIIYDRHGTELVRSRSAFSVAIVPGGIPREAPEVLDLLGEILDRSRDELLDMIRKGQGFPYEPVRIVRDVDPSTVIAIEENRMRLPGVFIQEEPVREYLYGDLASHTLGHLGIISERELASFGATYSGSDLVGRSGLEHLFEEKLRGLPGTHTVEVNAISRPIQTVSYLEPIPGHNLVLSLDHRLQALAYQVFEEHTVEVRERFPNAFNGAVVAIKPQTGEILALVSVPSYDPGMLIDVSSRNQYYHSLVRSPRQPFFNRALQGQYGPGSAFKPFSAVAILEEGVVSPDDVFNATGTSRYGVRDWVITQRLAPFGEIDFVDAMAMSSNHYFAEFGVRVGIDSLSEWIRQFGFGASTGLLAAPADAPGVVPDRQWKRERFRGRPTYEQMWYPSDTEQVSIGQGFITVTPLQMAVAYSAIANRGTVYQPRLVTQLIGPDGTTIQEYQPQVVRELAVAPETWDSVIEGMTGAITHRRGTARTAFADFPMSVAGKTGSYEIPGRDSHGWFAAFAPIDDPEIAVVVVVEHGGGGASGAAPIARRIMDAYFDYDQEAEAGIND